MKTNIHPKYYPKAKVTCACGNTFEVGATIPEIHTEICSACHPYYTGKHKLVDAARRVDKFKARFAKFQELKTKKVQKKSNLQKKSNKLQDKK